MDHLPLIAGVVVAFIVGFGFGRKSKTKRTPLTDEERAQQARIRAGQKLK